MERAILNLCLEINKIINLFKEKTISSEYNKTIQDVEEYWFEHAQLARLFIRENEEFDQNVYNTLGLIFNYLQKNNLANEKISYPMVLRYLFEKQYQNIIYAFLVTMVNSFYTENTFCSYSDSFKFILRHFELHQGVYKDYYFNKNSLKLLVELTVLVKEKKYFQINSVQKDSEIDFLILDINKTQSLENLFNFLMKEGC